MGKKLKSIFLQMVPFDLSVDQAYTYKWIHNGNDKVLIHNGNDSEHYHQGFATRHCTLILDRLSSSNGFNSAFSSRQMRGGYCLQTKLLYFDLIIGGYHQETRSF